MKKKEKKERLFWKGGLCVDVYRPDDEEEEEDGTATTCGRL